jgi:folate-binding protein YgfZ
MKNDVHGREAAAAGFALGQGQALPAHYGSDPEAKAVEREYNSARSGAAVLDLADRAVLVVGGPHRQKFLHSMLSNDILGAQPGESRQAAFMNVKGHILALMRAVVTKDEVLLEMPADRLKRVEEALLHYKVGAPVRFQIKPVSILGLLGSQAPGVLERCGFRAPDLLLEAHALGTLAGQEVRVIRSSDLPGWVLHVPPEGAEQVWEGLLREGATPLGRHALDALRIERGSPWYGPDVTEDNLLHETGLLSVYHSPTKGCYLGQEVVARLEGRGGHVNKIMRGLRLAAPVEPGSSLVSAGKEVGRVTTAAVSPRLGPIALAYIHRSHSAPGSEVEAGGVEATVVVLPFEES